MSRSKADVKMIFGMVAPQYEALIVPAFRQFAAAVITTVSPQGGEHTLDIGTGTGILARMIAPQVKSVVGIDLAPEMIAYGNQALTAEGLLNVTLQETDAHEMPFESESFDLVISSFGLNATRPSRVFPEIRRVLKPGGVLVFHEWAVQHELDTVLIDVLAKYMLDEDEIDDDLRRIRDFVRRDNAWHNVFQDAEDFEDELPEHGFREIQVYEDVPVRCVMPLNNFMQYKLAWTNRRAELDAMDEWRRADCLDAVRREFQSFADFDGNIVYDPALFRVYAVTG